MSTDHVGVSLVAGDLSGSSFGSVARLVQDCKIVLIICFVGRFRCVSRSVEDAVAGSLLPRLPGLYRPSSCRRSSPPAS
jgi:hypothetical protein